MTRDDLDDFFRRHVALSHGHPMRLPDLIVLGATVPDSVAESMQFAHWNALQHRTALAAQSPAAPHPRNRFIPPRATRRQMGMTAKQAKSAQDQR
jgi:hypothetical protein